MLIHLDTARGLAALLVMVGHVRGVFLTNLSSLHGPSRLILLPIYASTGIGHQAVIIFFVLSGFFIGVAVQRSIKERSWSWRLYAIRRMTRLMVVLVPALVLVITWDRLGLWLYGPTIYGGPLPGEYVIQFSIASRDTIREFLGNLFFLQEIKVWPLGSNAALWSLSYEFWYYMAFPLMILVLLGQATGLRRIAFVLALIAIFIFVGPTISIYFLIWLMGAVLAAVAVWRPNWLTGLHASATVLGTVAVLFTLVAAVLARDATGDFLVAVGFSAFVTAVLSRPDVDRVSSPPTLYTRIAGGLAGSSYTLYLTHLPIIIFVRAALVGSQRWQPDPIHLLAAAGVAALALLYALMIASLTERRTGDVRRWLEDRLGVASRPLTQG